MNRTSYLRLPESPFWLLTAVLSMGLILGGELSLSAENFQQARQALMREVAADVKALRIQMDQDSLSDSVTTAMLTVPRHEFVPQNYQRQAYENRPIPIGYGQTISQPLIVAIMTDLLRLDADDRVFELGTGSGYQAAILSRLVKQVYTMEIIPPLAEKAEQVLTRLNYGNVQVRVGDGYHGWDEAAPFDAIIVTAAGDHVPPPLVRQLKPGGHMVIPVGSRFFTQQLVLITKNLDGTLETRELLPVAFVPLTGDH